MSDFYAQLEEQLVAAGRRRNGQGRAHRMLAGRGRRLAAAGALAVTIAAAVVVSVTPLQRDAVQRRPAPATLAPSVQADLSGIRVAILNGTTRTGLARATAGELDARHARIASTGNAAGQQVALTEVRYRRGARAKALRVAAALGVGRIGPSTSSQPRVGRADVIVLVGADRQYGATWQSVPRPAAPPMPPEIVPEAPTP